MDTSSALFVQSDVILTSLIVLKGPPYLATQVDNVGVRVVEGQQDPVAGVHLVEGYWLLHVFLEMKKKINLLLMKNGTTRVHTRSVLLTALWSWWDTQQWLPHPEGSIC